MSFRAPESSASRHGRTTRGEYGHTNLWSLISVDEQIGYAYLPLTSPTSDIAGDTDPAALSGPRHPGGQARLVGLRPARGADPRGHHRRWPTGSVQLTKQAFAFVFDRVTGQPVWPIEDRPVPQSKTPGEQTSPTQPFTKPPAFDRQGVTVDDLIDFTPELRAAALEIAKQCRHRADVHAALDQRQRRTIQRADPAARLGRRRRLAGRRVRSRVGALYVQSPVRSWPTSFLAIRSKQI